MADGDPYNSVRTCAKLGCERPVKHGQGNHRYCAEHHRGGSSPRRSYRKVMQPDGPFRPEAEIRADLAAQLTAQVRRSNSMVAHDAATHPLR